MEWQAEALVMGVRPHGESSVVLEVMTAEHGRHLGLVKGGRSARRQPTLQPGNAVEVTWRARLDAHLGHFTVDLKAARAARLMESAAGLFGLQVVTAHLRYLPERDPHAGLYTAAGVVLDHLDDPVDGAHLIARFELALLEELGFGLDLTACAATGTTEDLVFVSPKSGRAVSRAAGAPYRDRMLALPAFLGPDPPAERPGRDAVLAALRLTGFFLDRHVADPRGIPLAPARAQLIDRLAALPADAGSAAG